MMKNEVLSRIDRENATRRGTARSGKDKESKSKEEENDDECRSPRGFRGALVVVAARV